MSHTLTNFVVTWSVWASAHDEDEAVAIALDYIDDKPDSVEVAYNMPPEKCMDEACSWEGDEE